MQLIELNKIEQHIICDSLALTMQGMWIHVNAEINEIASNNYWDKDLVENLNSIIAKINQISKLLARFYDLQPPSPEKTNNLEVLKRVSNNISFWVSSLNETNSRKYSDNNYDRLSRNKDLN